MSPQPRAPIPQPRQPTPAADAWMRWQLAHNGPWSLWHLMEAETGLACCGWSPFKEWAIEYGPHPKIAGCPKCEKVLEHYLYAEAL